MKTFFQQDSIPRNNQASIADSNINIPVHPTESLNVQSGVTKNIDTSLAPLDSIAPVQKADSVFRALETKQANIRKKEVKEVEKPEKIKAVKQEVELPGNLILPDSALYYANFNNTGSQHSILKHPDIFRLNSTVSVINQDDVKENSRLNLYPSDFFLGIIMMVSVMIISAKMFFSKYFSNYFQIALNYQLASNTLRDKNTFLSRFNSILNVVYIIILSIFIYQVVHFFDIKPNLQKVHFVYFTIFLTTLAMARVVVLKTLGEVFVARKSFDEYLFNQFVFNKLLGLVLFPIVFIMPYVSHNLRSFLIYAGIFLVIISFLIKLLRGFTIIIKKDILLFYVLLYLCTLEILPIMVGVSYFKRLV